MKQSNETEREKLLFIIGNGFDMDLGLKNILRIFCKE